MTTKEPILTPDIEALLQRYVEITQDLLTAAHPGPATATAVGTTMHIQMEVIFTLQHAHALLSQKIIERDPNQVGPDLALLLVRHATYGGIIQTLATFTNGFIRTFSARKEPMHIPPGTDVPVPLDHPGIVITPMGKKP